MADLRDLKRLRRIKATCIMCGNVRHFTREEVRPIWRTIDQKEEMPVTWDMACGAACEGLAKHFLDWPDAEEKK